MSKEIELNAAILKTLLMLYCVLFQLLMLLKLSKTSIKLMMLFKNIKKKRKKILLNYLLARIVLTEIIDARNRK